MQDSLLTRDDTIFGICEGLGEDVGINPTFLRVVFAVSILWNPPISIGVYVACGMTVLISRLVFPVVARGKQAAVPADAAHAHTASNDDHPVDLAKAA